MGFAKQSDLDKLQKQIDQLLKKADLKKSPVAKKPAKKIVKSAVKKKAKNGK